MTDRINEMGTRALADLSAVLANVEDQGVDKFIAEIVVALTAETMRSGIPIRNN